MCKRQVSFLEMNNKYTKWVTKSKITITDMFAFVERILHCLDKGYIVNGVLSDLSTGSNHKVFIKPKGKHVNSESRTV